ncbi:MAG: N-acetylmuramoyl-L-alanine amidase [Bacteroidales bacterium]|nr:N-acetylmuramoyl-L-alanine amidase [Bacteroidales bacterium]
MNIKNAVLLFALLTFFNIVGEAQSFDKVTKVVIDAGHGGKDAGAVGRREMEKNVVLSVALKLGKLITDNYSDVQVIYTRKTDVFVELYRRAQIANDNHAQLFISLHCNSSENRAPSGVETFVMGLHKSEANFEVAKKENAAMLLEKNYSNNYGGFDPNSPEAHVMFSLYTSAYLNNSILFADKVQKNLVASTHFIDRKVKQAGFWVLYKVAMPSVLVELGFISNYEEESKLMKSSTHDLLAASIYNAFVDYKNQLERTDKPGIDLKPLQKAVAEATKTAPKPEVPVIETPKTDTVAANNQEKAVPNLEIRFRVQFYTSPKDEPVTDAKFANIKDVRRYQQNGVWKYTSGNETSEEAAQQILKQLRKNGYSDAFMVAFKNEVRITMSEARELIKN